MNPAWREQCRAIAALAVLAVLLNWFTTGDHLLKTVGTTLLARCRRGSIPALGGLAGVGISAQAEPAHRSDTFRPHIKTSHA
jgi:hypothetical protein